MVFFITFAKERNLAKFRFRENIHFRENVREKDSKFARKLSRKIYLIIFAKLFGKIAANFLQTDIYIFLEKFSQKWLQINTTIFEKMLSTFFRENGGTFSRKFSRKIKLRKISPNPHK